MRTAARGHLSSGRAAAHADDAWPLVIVLRRVQQSTQDHELGSGSWNPGSRISDRAAAAADDVTRASLPSGRKAEHAGRADLIEPRGGQGAGSWKARARQQAPSTRHPERGAMFRCCSGTPPAARVMRPVRGKQLATVQEKPASGSCLPSLHPATVRAGLPPAPHPIATRIAAHPAPDRQHAPVP